MTEIDTNLLKTFTTEPKVRRFLKRGAFISQNRAIELMEHFWNLKLWKCNYETGVFEFIQKFGTNDKRTIERYLGRPEQIIESQGITESVRMNRNTGQNAIFHYRNRKKISARRGLMEILGYITLKQEEEIIQQGTVILSKKTKNWILSIHHERMDYYTRQGTLEEASSIQEVKVRVECSNDKTCVCSIPQFSQGEGSEGNRFEKVPLDVETIERKKEEEVIDDTHTNQSSESEQKPKSCINCGRIDASNPYRIWCPLGKGERSRLDSCISEVSSNG